MAVLEPLVTSLQLAGLPYADIQHSLEQACSDKSTAEVLHWLGSTAAKQLISHGLALQSATQQSESQRSLQPCLPPTTITAMVKDQEGQALLQPDLVTAGLQESIQDKESSLLLHQDQLSRLRRLSIAANTQATSSQQAAAKHHQQELQQRRNKTKQHLDAQQAALNQVLTDVQKTASSLCFTAEQHIQGSCLALSDLTSLQRESAALNQAIERYIPLSSLRDLSVSKQSQDGLLVLLRRLYIEQTQGSAAASMQPQHVDLTQRHDGNVPQFDFLASVLKGPDSQVQLMHPHGGFVSTLTEAASHIHGHCVAHVQD